MVDWVPGTLRFMDGLAARSDWMEFARFMGREPTMKSLPSEYWATNCFAGASPPARIEYEMRYELGVDTMMFGVDYPHFETIWPVTKETVQGTLGCIGVPEPEARKILMENPARAYGFDLEALGAAHRPRRLRRIGAARTVECRPRRRRDRPPPPGSRTAPDHLTASPSGCVAQWRHALSADQGGPMRALRLVWARRRRVVSGC